MIMNATVRWSALLLAWGLLVTEGSARLIHVDNQNGNDANDGLSEEIQTAITGPIQTLRRALQIARQGDTINILNTGIPYAEELNLVGRNHSGFSNQPFVIQGNGAVLSGVALVPSEGWQSRSDGVWELSLTRKGYYRFFLDGESIPEQRFADSRWDPSELAVDHWARHRGVVRFRLADGVSPFSQNWTYAAAELGISLVNVSNVRIENLTVSGFRIDGINVDGNSSAITLDGVTVQHVGRAGVAIGGTSQVELLNSRVLDCGRDSVIITERAGAIIEGSDLGGVEPAVVPITP